MKNFIILSFLCYEISINCFYLKIKSLEETIKMRCHGTKAPGRIGLPGRVPLGHGAVGLLQQAKRDLILFYY